MEQGRKRLLIISGIGGILLLVIDLVIKFIINHTLPYQEQIGTFLPFLKFFRTHNTGYHFIFGVIENHKLWAGFGVVMVAILIFSLSYSILKENHPPFYRNIYAIIMALTIGASANVWEILFSGRATDFFVLDPFPWPSNICDQYINAIIYLMLPAILIKSFIDWREHKKVQKEEKE